MSNATRPPWRKLRKLLAAISHGIPPERAASLANLPVAITQEPRLAEAIFRAQAVHQRNALAVLEAAARDTVKLEYQWQRVPEDQAPVLAVSPDGSVDNRAPVRARAIPRPGDWKAVAWKLERLYPAEYGQQQPQQVASAVVDVLHALAALRTQPASLAIHRPLALDATQARRVADTPATGGTS